VGHGDLARLRGVTAADQTGVTDGVMRRAERPHGHERPSWLEAAHGAVDAGGLQALGGGQRRQDGWQALGEQGLARAGGADHQKKLEQPASLHDEANRKPGSVFEFSLKKSEMF